MVDTEKGFDVIISKVLLKEWLKDNPIIKQSEFSKMAGIGNLTTHFFMDKFSFRISTLEKVAKVAVKYGYLNWFEDKRFKPKDLEKLDAVTVNIEL